MPDLDGVGRDLPAYVQDQLTFYARAAKTARRGYLALETLAIVAASAVPVTVALHWSTWVPAALGAISASLAGARNVYGWQRNWASHSATLEAIKLDVAKYNERDPRRGELVTKVGEIVLTETGSWRERLLAVALQSPQEKASDAADE